MAISKSTFIVGALAACGFCGAVYGTFYSLAARPHSTAVKSLGNVVADNERSTNSELLVVRGGSSPTRKAPSQMRATTSQPAEAQAWLDQEFPNKVYPEITHQADLRKDNPAEYERQVRALNPDYAKILDEEALSDQAKERAQRELDREAEQHRLASERAERERAAAQ